MMSVLKTEVLPLNYSPFIDYKYYKFLVKNWFNKVIFLILKNKLDKTIKLINCLLIWET